MVLQKNQSNLHIIFLQTGTNINDHSYETKYDKNIKSALITQQQLFHGFYLNDLYKHRSKFHKKQLIITKYKSCTTNNRILFTYIQPSITMNYF